MTLTVCESVDTNLIEVDITGKLEKADYDRFVPLAEASIEKHGKIRVLFIMRDFRGWTAGAMWEDIKFDVKHFKDIERLAMVGDKKWEKGMAMFCKPFTTATIRYFDLGDIDAAREWIGE
ncbi:MAG: STAS/SEC14 domain-containing protein [Planctomycetes bacterium]|nr:STAS/SEC14 domain-containing protein [Planctomycetota bacterium]